MTHLGNSFPGNEHFPETTEKEGAIPDDVSRMASAAADKIFAQGYMPASHGYVRGVIVRAVLAARERSAKVAEDTPVVEVVRTSADSPELTFSVGAAAQRNAIATAIRKGGDA